VANGTRYGLQAGVATRSFERFMAIATRLRVGGVALMDGPNFDSPQIPFGGVKASGIGREGIRYTMREMSNVKTVLLPWAGPDGSVRV
jgi:acyl-CoA reductase-like NAD-dependent aldehyde dehydrogenase